MMGEPSNDTDNGFNIDGNNSLWEEIDNQTNTALGNIIMCGEACQFLFSVDTVLRSSLESGITGHSSLFSTEETLLDIASSGEAEGIFFCVTFRLIQENISIVRFFEHGCYKGAMKSSMQETINTMIEDENSHYIEVFNDHDVENKLKRESLLKKKKGPAKTKRSNFHRKLLESKESVGLNLPFIAKELNVSGQIKCTGIIARVERNNAKNDKDKLWYTQEMLDHRESLAEKLREYKLSALGKDMEKNLRIFDRVAESSLDFREQLEMICSIPNFYKWLWTLDDPSKQQVKFEQKFSSSTRYLPGSPRNRIVHAVALNGSEHNVITALNTMLNIYVQIDNSSGERPRKRRKCNVQKARPVIDKNLLCQSLGVDPQEVDELSKQLYSAEQQTLYLTFVEKLFANGCINWRLKNSSSQVILMNNYDAETGEFKLETS
ncbi:uncharacterized protein [Clytia hemisphaerica]|uniref:uncharacterized protein n=1 Tax=Clytia hemisphaerica TaxID=252671 RepID=UPI0034D47995